MVSGFDVIAVLVDVGIDRRKMFEKHKPKEKEGERDALIFQS